VCFVEAVRGARDNDGLRPPIAIRIMVSDAGRNIVTLTDISAHQIAVVAITD